MYITLWYAANVSCMLAPVPHDLSLSTKNNVKIMSDIVGQKWQAVWRGRDLPQPSI